MQTTAETGDSRRPGWGTSGATLLGLVLVAALYLPFVGNGFLYDDFALIFEPPPVESAGDVVDLFTRPFYPTLIYYRPVASATYSLQRALAGAAPAGFHLVNVLLAGALFLAAARLLRRPGIGLAERPAVVCALLFAIHPVISSSVFPVSGRDTLLAAVWTLAAVNAFSRTGWRAYAAGLALFGLALLTKESAVMLPGLVLAADVFGISARDGRRALAGWVLRYLPLGVLLVAYLTVRHALFGSAGSSLGAAADVPLAYVYTLQVAVAPFVELLYEPRIAGWWSWWRILFVAAACVFAALALRRADRPTRRRVAFWAAWFVITLLPQANFLEQETRFAERYALLPVLAPLAVAATWFASVRRPEGGARKLVTVGMVLLGLVYAGIVIGRGSSWAGEAFYRAWIRHDPGRLTAYYNLGTVLAREGRLEEAVPWYEQALDREPNYGDAHNNLGAALVRLERFDEALPHLEAAVRINPVNFQAHHNLGAELSRRGDTAAAIRHYAEAARLRPEVATVRRDLANLLVANGNVEEAVTHFRGVARLEPENPRAHNNLGSALALMGSLDEATAEFRRAVELEPSYPNARVNLGHALVARGETQEALEEFRAALNLDGSYADAHYGMATALLALDRREEALASLREALRLDPGHVNARRLAGRPPQEP
jgi:tetratricopeptide (TPR) repeat protein